MKVLVVGGGGREHALVWSLLRTGNDISVLCAPGNAGIADLVPCLPVQVNDLSGIERLVHDKRPDLVVVGPEVPLAAGLVDLLQSSVPVFGPTQAAAQLETSKAFAKDFMRRWDIPTAAYQVCHSPDEVRACLPLFPAGVVVKADGLAAGKGVKVCETHETATEAAAVLFQGSSGADALVLEERLTGPELSFFAVCDGTRALPLAAAQDHKRLGEGDSGPNTGGMGAYSTPSMLSPELAEECLSLASRVVEAMAAEHRPFVGMLFLGLMLTPDGLRVLEFNTRFGDPETEAILLRLESPLATLLLDAARGDLSRTDIRLSDKAAACVVAVSAGYPSSYQPGHPITGLTHVPDEVEIFHAGTALDASGCVVTAGGRVLVVAAAANQLGDALDSVYTALSGIHFEGIYFRRDIGARAL